MRLLARLPSTDAVVAVTTLITGGLAPTPEVFVVVATKTSETKAEPVAGMLPNAQVKTPALVDQRPLVVMAVTNSALVGSRVESAAFRAEPGPALVTATGLVNRKPTTAGFGAI